ncbi:hexokinase-1-like [Tubulanus polymorphus]|uniref:hexokinase-1-like n=1 Tax=Tubulanus polymorphus TaxID=672921 RepID=UPI003DA28A71
MMSHLLHYSNCGPIDELITGVSQSIVSDLDEELNLNDETLNRMMRVMEEEMKNGLSRDEKTRKQSSLQMENTYVRDVLDGTEDGDFLALDLGGTNFRVLRMIMRAGKLISFVSRNYNVSAEKLHGPAIGVFDHLAESIAKFLEEENIKDKKMSLGFTFSFPMVQEGLRKGILVTWTKSFKCPDGVGEDAVKMLEDAIHRRGDINVEVVAILNDTTGTLMAGAYIDHHCQIGLILGTGSNASYVEHLENVDKWTQPIEDPKKVLIDIEWGAFGDNGSLDFLKTDCDRLVDKTSNHVGSFTFEKLFAGLYLGELLRNYLVKFSSNGSLFSGKQTEALCKVGTVKTSHVSNIEKDVFNLENTKAFLREIGLLEDASPSDVAAVRLISELITIRAAKIISTALSVLLHHVKKPEVTIAVDGSLYEYHPTLKHLMQAELDRLVPKTKSKLILAEDGSGRGAGFVVAVVSRLQKYQLNSI